MKSCEYPGCKVNSKGRGGIGLLRCRVFSDKKWYCTPHHFQIYEDEKNNLTEYNQVEDEGNAIEIMIRETIDEAIKVLDSEPTSSIMEEVWSEICSAIAHLTDNLNYAPKMYKALGPNCFVYSDMVFGNGRIEIDKKGMEEAYETIIKFMDFMKSGNKPKQFQIVINFASGGIRGLYHGSVIRIEVDLESNQHKIRYYDTMMVKIQVIPVFVKDLCKALKLKTVRCESGFQSTKDRDCAKRAAVYLKHIILNEVDSFPLCVKQEYNKNVV